MQAQATLTKSSQFGMTSKLFPWMVWGVSALFVSFQMLLQTSPSVMIANLEQAFSINAFGVSLLSSSFFYSYVLLQIPAGMLIDRIQPRYCLTVCLIGIALMTLMFATTESLTVARTGRMLQGAFSAPSVVPALFLAAIWFPSQRFALLAGLTEMIGMLGSAVGQAVLAPSCGYFGWRETMIGCALVGFILAGITWFVVRNKAPDGTDETTHATETPAPHQTHIFRNLLTVISYPQAWINGLFSGLLFAVAAAFASFWCIPFLIQAYGVTLNVAASASAMALVGVALGAPSIGWLSDRFGVRRLPMIISTMIVLVLMLIVLYVPAIPLVTMFGLLFALGFFSSAYVLPFAVMRDIMPAHVRGTAMGYTNMMSIMIGAPIIQPFIGWMLNSELSHTTNQAAAYQHALVVLPVCLALGCVLAFFVKETYCGKNKKVKDLHSSRLQANESDGCHYAEP
jgi:MFS family permease